MLEGRGAVVTGAGGNVGRHVLGQLLAQGARVVAAGHSDASMSLLAGARADEHERCMPVRADVTTEDGAAQLHARAHEFLGHADILVNLVGGFQYGNNLWELSLDDWQHMMDLNLKSAFLCCRAFIPEMIEAGYGRIVNVSSRAAFNLKPKRAAYNISKAGVATLTQVLREELRGTGVTATAVAPGTIDTESNRESMPKADPANWVLPERLAETITYLCSDAAGALSGAVTPVYGEE